MSGNDMPIFNISAPDRSAAISHAQKQIEERDERIAELEAEVEQLHKHRAKLRAVEGLPGKWRRWCNYQKTNLTALRFDDADELEAALKGENDG